MLCTAAWVPRPSAERFDRPDLVVLADDTARWIKSQLSADLEAMYADLKK